MTDIRAALEALDLHCENFTGNDHRPAYDQCLRFGRTPDAHYGAERTCWPCTIRAALAAASPEPERTTIWYVPDCGYTHLSDDGTIYAVCPDGLGVPVDAPARASAMPMTPLRRLRPGVKPHAPAAPTVEALRDALVKDVVHAIESMSRGSRGAVASLTARLDAIIAAARADERTRLSGDAETLRAVLSRMERNIEWLGEHGATPEEMRAAWFVVLTDLDGRPSEAEMEAIRARGIERGWLPAQTTEDHP